MQIDKLELEFFIKIKNSSLQIVKKLKISKITWTWTYHMYNA